MGFNLATILVEATKTNPDKVAAYCGDEQLTYRELDSLATQFATGLRAQGITPGDVVAFQLPNIPQFLIAYFGALKSGATALPLNPLLTAPELEYHLSDSGAKLFVSFALTASAAAKAAAATGVPLYVVGASKVPDSGLRDFSELLGSAEIDPHVGDVWPTSGDDTAVLVYTSGTTGKPKGAMLGHSALFMACDLGGRAFGLEADDVGLGALPLFHVFGLCSVLHAVIRFGATIVLIPRFDVEPVMDAIEQRRVTVLPGVPTMFTALMSDRKERDLTKLRVAVSGGAAMPGALMKAFETKFPNLWVMEGYGLTETSAAATQNPGRDERREQSIGKPSWGVDIRVVDKDGNELPPGPDNVGEFLIRGPMVMKGYHGRPEATDEAMSGGWLHTGDLGYRDEDGFLYIVDRSKDLIIRGGFNVYPREIEEVLFAHPAIIEAAVIGKPDERLGEEVVAVVALHDGQEVSADELTAYCKERLAAYKYPREFRFMDELPKNATGKILKTVLRKTTPEAMDGVAVGA